MIGKQFFSQITILIIGLLLSSGELLPAQVQATLGVSFTVGKPTNRLGLTAALDYNWKKVKIEGQFSGWYYLNGLGTAQNRLECRASAGIGYSWGKELVHEDYFIHRNHKRNNSFAYSYLYYFEKYTPHAAGSLKWNFNNFEMILENDALGWQGKDRYRTGAINLAWYKSQNRFAANIQLWTGNPHDPLAKSFPPPENSKARWGYRDLSNTRFGKISHGILAFDFARDIGYNTIFNSRIGIDDERVRHYLQNKLFHDWILFFGKYTEVKNRHVPMLDSNGYPFLGRSHQNLRATKSFFELGLNAPVFY